jgi:TRAP-type C4-dicarboxylate transport system substrate-binding protein
MNAAIDLVIIMDKTFGSWRAMIGAALASLFVSTGIVFAGEVRLATTQVNDPFVAAVRSSKYLQDAGITVVVVGMPKDVDVLDSLVKGSADVGLFELSSLSVRRFENQPQLYSVFTRPFLFNSASELVDIQNTPLGDAVLSDVGRAGILPLGFQNRGLSQIWSRSPVYMVDHFRDLTVANSSADNSNGEFVLTSLGAKPTRVSMDRKGIVFETGQVNATVWEPRDNNKPDPSKLRFTVYATEFEPKVGIIASSISYWDSISEADAAAWKQAVQDIQRRTNDRIRAADALSRKYVIVINNTEREKSLRSLTSAVAASNKTAPQLTQDFELVDEAKAFIKANDPVVKKSRTESRKFACSR